MTAPARTFQVNLGTLKKSQVFDLHAD